MLLTTFAASLLGSVHCAGMCGAFATIACMPGMGSPGSVAASLTVHARPVDHTGLWLSALYNGGRLLTYAALGALAGTLGAALDLGAQLSGVAPVASTAAGALLATIGVVLLLRVLGVPVPHVRPGPGWIARVGRLHAAARALDPRSRALAVGVLTPLLPCGWLYAFVATSAGAGSALGGAATMTAFWLGTLPMMAALSIGMRRVTGPMASRLPLASALALIVVGVATVAGRVWLPRAMEDSGGPAAGEMFCNGR
jgi:sulfite exporter TauE/SafE